MSRFATLDSIRKRDDGDDKAGETNTLYAGGATNGGSGVNVMGPRRGGAGAGARGGAGGPELDRLMSSIPTRDADAPPAADELIIAFYANGFTVGDGPLRDYEAPENKQFVASLNKGEIPRELEQAHRDRKLRVAVRDMRPQEFRPPTPPAYVAFSGTGCTMADEPVAVSDKAKVSADAAAASATFSVDESKPTTSVRVQFADGTTKVFKFNRTHTVRDLVAQVALFSTSDAAFVLMGGFPPKPLDVTSDTLEAAGLLQASVRQRLC